VELADQPHTTRSLSREIPSQLCTGSTTDMFLVRRKSIHHGQVNEIQFRTETQTSSGLIQFQSILPNRSKVTSVAVSVCRKLWACTTMP